MSVSQALLDRRVAIPDAVVARELDGETVLLNLDTGIYFGLDPVGTRIWQLLAGSASLGDLLAVLEAEYTAERDTLQRDLLQLVAQLQAKGLVTLNPST